MTRTSTVVKIQYAGDGSTSSFTVPFVFYDDDDPQVISTVDSTAVDTNLVRGTHYTISGGDGAAGAIAMVTSPNDSTPASGETLTIKMNLPDTQPTGLPTGGPLPAATIERMIDKVVALVQQTQEQLDRSLLLKEGSGITGITVPDPVAGKSLVWDSTAAFLENATPTEGGSLTIPVTLANGGTGATTAAGAKTNLGLDDVDATIALAKFNHGGL